MSTLTHTLSPGCAWAWPDARASTFSVSVIRLGSVTGGGVERKGAGGGDMFLVAVFIGLKETVHFSFMT